MLHNYKALCQVSGLAPLRHARCIKQVNHSATACYAYLTLRTLRSLPAQCGCVRMILQTAFSLNSGQGLCLTSGDSVL